MTEQKINRKAKCYNCVHADKSFKIVDVTYQHCKHPKYTREQFESGELTPWDTLMKFSDTCKDHEYKTLPAETKLAEILNKER